MISIRNAEVERLARELATAEGKSMTETILEALQRLKTEAAGEGERKKAILKEIARPCALAPDLDLRQPEAILGYDDIGAFHYGSR